MTQKKAKELEQIASSVGIQKEELWDHISNVRENDANVSHSIEELSRVSEKWKQQKQEELGELGMLRLCIEGQMVANRDYLAVFAKCKEINNEVLTQGLAKQNITQENFDTARQTADSMRHNILEIAKSNPGNEELRYIHSTLNSSNQELERISRAIPKELREEAIKELEEEEEEEEVGAKEQDSRDGLREGEQEKFAQVRKELPQLTNIPEHGYPLEIAGRQVREVSGENWDSYLRAVPLGAKPDLSEQDLGDWPSVLRIGVEDRFGRFGRVTDDRMLNPGEPEGQAALLIMHDMRLIDLNRGVVVYNMRNNRVEGPTVIVESSDGQYNDAHAVLRNEAHRRFYAIKNRQPLGERQEDSPQVQKLRDRVERLEFAIRTKDILDQLASPTLGHRLSSVPRRELPRAQKVVDEFMKDTTQDDRYDQVRRYYQAYKRFHDDDASTRDATGRTIEGIPEEDEGIS